MATVVVALTALSVPAGADPRNPTPADLARAQQRVRNAQATVQSLQVRAELAAERYNGALVRMQHAQAARATTSAAASVAEIAFQTAQTTAAKAASVAAAASEAAQQATIAQQHAQAQANAAQLTMDRVVVGALQSGGELSMVSALFLAHDPQELASGRILLNHVSAYQDKVVAEAVRTRNVARAATLTAQATQEQATQTDASARASLDRAATARDIAASAQQQAAGAAATAVAAAASARSARATALALVAQAQAALGSAVQTAAQLQAAAAAARRDAAAYEHVDAPSDAARIAIHWAFQEIGVPYSWGGGDENGPTYGFAQGAGTKGFDCSGLTLFAYAQAGIHLDHYTGSQWNESKRISRRSDLLPGDLMFFAYDTSDESTIHHVAIYIGNGRMIEAPYTGSVVRVSSADRSDFIGATRPWA